MADDDSKISAAILGLFAAIKICRREGYNPIELLRLVETKCEEWGLLSNKNGE